MGFKQNDRSTAAIVKWIGIHDPKVRVPHLVHKNVFFYSKCIFGPLTLNVGDFILVSSADSPEPDTIAGCDIAKILHLYELREMSATDPCRAIVQWYSRPECIPHQHFDNDDICIDFNHEVIEEYRPYDPDISLETIFRKCIVICGNPEESASALLQEFGRKRSCCPMFVCRYKFVKVKKSYRLVPLTFANDNESSSIASSRTRRQSDQAGVEAKSASGKKKRRFSSVVEESRKRHASTGPTNAVEFIDIDYFSSENKVSPIKIIGGRSVVKLSGKKRAASVIAAGDKDNEIETHHMTASPLAEKNVTLTSVHPRVVGARRNLNLSLNNGADSTAESDCLNYSIVKGTPDPQVPANEMKIKLRLSGSRRSTRLTSMEEDPLAINESSEFSCKSTDVPNVDIYRTPTKRPHHTPTPEMTDTVAEPTPPTRRKSILKSASTRLAEDTPKRSIQLSNIVEKRIFQEDDVIATPKRSRQKKPFEPDGTDLGRKECSPKESEQKTPSRLRRSSVKMATDVITPKTPAQKLKMIRTGEISPSIKQRRIVEEADSGKSDLQLARECLHVSVIPKSLPCREREFENIYTFLEGKIQDQCGGCMYVSGVPGTGKTATVTGVIRTLQQKAAMDELPNFEFLEINGMRLTEPRQAYVQIYKQLTGKTVSWEHAHALLEKRFTTPAPRRITSVLLVDELDILCNRRQDVVYNLLDWPTKSAARLVVVTIANTMDLPERLLMGKVTSRLGLTRLTFQPYTHKQLQEIVMARLSGSEAFKSDAVQLVARKVAAVSGDARRALDICRRATEIADVATTTNTGNTVTNQCVNMQHVQQALSEMIASAKVQSIKNCSRQEKIFLQAVVAEVMRTGVEETSFMGVYTQIETIAAFMGASVPTTGHALRICSKLGAERLLICEHSRNDIFQKILLNVSTDDIHYALRVNAASG